MAAKREGDQPGWLAGVGHALKSVMVALVFAVPAALMEPALPKEMVVDVLHPRHGWYRGLPYAYRYLVAWAVTSATRWKYYFVWKIAEASVDASGMGYQGRDKGWVRTVPCAVSHMCCC